MIWIYVIQVFLEGGDCAENFEFFENIRKQSDSFATHLHLAEYKQDYNTQQLPNLRRLQQDEDNVNLCDDISPFNGGCNLFVQAGTCDLVEQQYCRRTCGRCYEDQDASQISSQYGDASNPVLKTTESGTDYEKLSTDLSSNYSIVLVNSTASKEWNNTGELRNNSQSIKRKYRPSSSDDYQASIPQYFLYPVIEQNNRTEANISDDYQLVNDSTSSSNEVYEDIQKGLFLFGIQRQQYSFIRY
eukprot:TRINITY_DN4913_c0_g1_i5.p2 TRINITY_DN4913_c0_g1~~TRINITY_DN4913_c0_g1_i5.p2  ORF type:complete len:244 (-),score=14.62 TRINITY_DN4913_c0_g1_i5:373-1104(-)